MAGGLYCYTSGHSLSNRCRIIGWQKCTSWANLASVYLSLGDADLAVSYANKSVDIAKMLDNDASCFLTIGTLVTLGNCYWQKYEFQTSKVHFESALELTKQARIEGGKVLATAHIGLGMCARKREALTMEAAQEEHEQEVEHFTRALELFTDENDLGGMAAALNNLGTAYQHQAWEYPPCLKTSLETAITYLLRSLDIKCGLEDPLVRASSQANLGKCFASLSEVDEENSTAHLEKARSYLEAAVSVNEKVWSNLSHQSHLMSFMDSYSLQTCFYMLQGVHILQGDAREAFAVSEQAKARVMTHAFVTETSSNQTDPEGTLHAADVECLSNEWNCTFVEFTIVPGSHSEHLLTWVFQPGQEMELFESKFNIKNDGSVEALTSAMYDTIKVVSEQLRTESPEEHVDIECNECHVRQGVRYRHVTGEYYLCEDCFNAADTEKQEACMPFLSCIVFDEKMYTQIQARLEAEQFNTLCDEKVLVMGTKTYPLASCRKIICATLLEELHAMLIKRPLTGNIVFVPTGSLFDVPFAALRSLDDKAASSFTIVPLIQNATSITIAPSITSLKMLHLRPSFSSNKVILIGVSESAIVPVRLDGVTAEVAIVNQASDQAGLECDSLMEQSATVDSVSRKCESSQAAVIHFTCHGLKEEVKDDDVWMPGALALSDGLLYAEDIAKWKIQAQLVILSCCDSNRGKRSAEGESALARAFLLAGAQSVISTQWPLNDRHAPAMMQQLYDGILQGRPIAECLADVMRRSEETGVEVDTWAVFSYFGFPQKSLTMRAPTMRAPTKTAQVFSEVTRPTCHPWTRGFVFSMFFVLILGSLLKKTLRQNVTASMLRLGQVSIA